MGNENTIKQRHLHTPATVNRTEAWLKQQAKEGWQLINFNNWNFIFRKCKPYEGEYLMYSTFGREFGLSFDYFMIAYKYGKSKGKSELNKDNVRIFEADITKLDKEYYRFVKTRNSNYLKHYIGLTVLWVIFLALALLIILFAPNGKKAMCILLLIIPALIYSVISLITLLKDVNKLKNQLADNPYNR